MKEFNLRQVKAEQDRAARRAGVSRRKEQLPGRQRVERPRPLIPACSAMRGPHPGPPLPSADLRARPTPAPRTRGHNRGQTPRAGPLGDSPSPDALHHQWRCARPAPGKVGGRGAAGGLGAAGLGPRAGWPREQSQGLWGFPPVTFRAGPTSLCAWPVLQEREPRPAVFGFVFLRARGIFPEDDGDFFFFLN